MIVKYVYYCEYNTIDMPPTIWWGRTWYSDSPDKKVVREEYKKHIEDCIVKHGEDKSILRGVMCEYEHPIMFHESQELPKNQGVIICHKH